MTGVAFHGLLKLEMLMCRWEVFKVYENLKRWQLLWRLPRGCSCMRNLERINSCKLCMILVTHWTAAPAGRFV